MKVFISYSHDSPEHVDRVLGLSDRLREDGIDCRIDQYEQSPPEGWPQWMANRMQEAGFVLVVCTQTYNLRFQGKEREGKGKGAKWEGAIIAQDLYEAEGKNRKFIPVLFDAEHSAHIPLVLRGAMHYDLSTDEGYELLYRRLTNQPRVRRPEVGKVKPMPPQERKQDFRTTLWHVPYERNPLFTGREDVLEKLEKTLESKGGAALTAVGGMGKTQIVLEYAWKHRADYKAVLWAKAGSREALLSDFADIARLLNLPAKDLGDQSLAAAAVKRRLEENTGWLLILDNADDFGMAREFIPAGRTGRVLVTTRDQATGRLARVEILKMEPEEGALFLLRRAKIIPEDAPLRAAEPANCTKAIKVSKEMDGLPLALDQAGAFIEKTPSSPAEYLKLYRTHGAKLRAKRGDSETHYPYSVATTWSLSFEKVEAASPAAADLLRLCAFLAADAIPEEIFTKGADDLGDTLGPAAKDPLKLTEALREAGRFSLIRRNPAGKTLDIHRLVQIVLKDGMDEEARRLWAERAVRALGKAFPLPDSVNNWPQCARLVRHVEVIQKAVEHWNLNSLEVARILNDAGYYLRRRAEQARAEVLITRALKLRESILELAHKDVAESLNNLAIICYDRGEYREAASLHQRALAIRKEALGSEDPAVAMSLNNLGLLYQAEGRYAEAENHYKQSLHILQQKSQTWLHRHMAMVLDNLGGLYHIRGKYTDAERLYKRAEDFRKKALGPDHPDVAAKLNNRGELYRVQGRYAEARLLYKRALKTTENALGPEHPQMATILNNLVRLYHAEGKYAEAERLCKSALDITKKALGPGHPDVATTLNNLAGLLHACGKYEKAERLYRRALETMEKALGPEHPDVASTLNNLGVLYRAQGKYAEAEPLFERSLAISEKALGSDHPDVATSLNNLAALYSDQGKYAEAEPLYQRSLAIVEKALGSDHPDVATVLENYAVLLKETNREAEAAKMEARARRIRGKKSG